MPVTLSAALPLFVSVTLSGALDVAMIWLPNPSDDGAIFATGALAIPVPVRATICFELVTFPELSVKSNSA
jgi:hypothetical protein